MTLAPVTFGEADLTNCDREPIHTPGSIQPHGAMLVLRAEDLRIVRAGGATAELLGVEVKNLLGAHLDTWVSGAQLAQLRGALRGGSPPVRPLQAFTMQRDGAACTTNCTMHLSGDLIVLELEPLSEPPPDDPLTRVQGMIRVVQKGTTTAEICQSIAEEVRTLTGFDRVMLYRFLSDGSGAVDAEAVSEGTESFLGLRYPASDIPQQARALYVQSWIRLIPDARYTPAPLLAVVEEQTAPALDLSQAALRSVSPIHLEYLANMGVVASMSLSIVIDGKLWGLIACHHRAPRYVPHRMRVALELFAQMASFQIETRSAAEDFEVRLRSKSIHEALVTNLGPEMDLATGLGRFRDKLLGYIPAEGLGLWLDGKYTGYGKALSEERAARLVGWLNKTTHEGVFETDRLSAWLPQAATWSQIASGILAVSVSRSPRDYMIWFRPERIQAVTWAGSPDKTSEMHEDGARLSPRKSFAAWRQDVRLQSEPWSTFDVKTAQALRISLLEVVLEHIDQLSRERERARVQQDALLAELDRRIHQWEDTAQQLKVEGDRRAVVEAELSQVLRRTVIEQEAERQRIARELHDSIGQFLAVMKLDLDGIGRHADASGPIRERVEKLKGLTTSAGQEVNQLAWEIRPTALDDLGLQTAIEQYVEEWSERTDLTFDVHLALSGRRLPDIVETALYRCLQECIRNVVKHSGARRVGVILEASAHEVRLIVEDDGKGFDLPEAGSLPRPPARLGLLGMRERLVLVGGTLELETSTDSGGTTLLIHVPL